jgi:hypothetical protein
VNKVFRYKCKDCGYDNPKKAQCEECYLRERQRIIAGGAMVCNEPESI